MGHSGDNMNFTNINDPAGVKALLDQLRSSQAWQDAVTPSEPVPSASHGRPASAAPHTPLLDPNVGPQAPATESSTPTSVASLLSQLQASPSYAAAAPPPPPLHEEAWPVAQQPPPAELPRPPVRDACPAGVSSALSSARPQDLRACTFQQALPHIAALSEDPAFIDAISTMKTEQTELERQLWEERCAIQLGYEEKVKVAATKAKMIGSGLTQYEADMMSDSFRRDLKKFDSQRALVAWDGLIAKQQMTLESLGVPAMFPTTAKTEREVQQKIMSVLAGIVRNETA